jgi:UDP-N-acetylmuramoylalanine--D-glutamate ligase
MRIAILGYADQGRSAYEYWKEGNEITVCDLSVKLELPEGTKSQLGPDYLKNLDEFDLLVRTSGLRPHDIKAANPESPNILDKVTTITDEFMKVCPSRNIIGVTGTKGKGTTSTLITKILEAAGKRVHLGGNIGIPPLDMLAVGIKSDDWVVLELASFQLIDIKHSPRVGVCLMVVPEHLNWHEDMAEYLKAKQQMFRYQTTDDLAIFNARSANSQEVVSVSPAPKVGYYVPSVGKKTETTEGAYVAGHEIFMNGKRVCSIEEVALLGRHNLENVCAAIAATWDIIDEANQVIRKVLVSFSGLPHRLEFIRQLGGVRYYDDSFGTTPETAIVALQAFNEPKVVILGGSDKNATFSELGKVVATTNVRKAVIIGETGPQIIAALKAAGFSDYVDGGTTMTEVLNTARKYAQSGDIVLLSTGCASYDLFKNYKDRGEQFKAAVLKLS